MTGPKSKQKASVQIKIRDLTIVAVQVNVPGPPVIAFKIGGVKTGGQRGFQEVVTHIANNGNVLVKPTGSVTVLNKLGTVLQVLTFKMDTFLPQTAVDYPLLLKKALPPGDYSAIVQLSIPGVSGAAAKLVSAHPSFSISKQDVQQVFTSAAPQTPPPGTVGASSSSKPPWAIIAAAVVAGLLVVLLLLRVLRRRRGPKPTDGSTIVPRSTSAAAADTPAAAGSVVERTEPPPAVPPPLPRSPSPSPSPYRQHQRPCLLQSPPPHNTAGRNAIRITSGRSPTTAASSARTASGASRTAAATAASSCSRATWPTRRRKPTRCTRNSAVAEYGSQLIWTHPEG